MAARERFRFFGGVALTPDPGFVGGLGMGLLRGLTCREAEVSC